MEDEEKLSKAVYVYSPDGHTLLHSYYDVQRVLVDSNTVRLALKYGQDTIEVTFSASLPYYEVELGQRMMSDNRKYATISDIGQDFFKLFVDCGIVKKTGPIYECDLIDMPRTHGWSRVVEWLDSLEDSIYKHVMDTLSKALREKCKIEDN